MPAILRIVVIATSVVAVMLQAQNGGNVLTIPKEASATAQPEQSLLPGQQFRFQLNFTPAPNGYHGGSVGYFFRKVGAKQPPNSPVPGQPPPDPVITGGGVPLEDGVSSYNGKVEVTEWMPPGTWELGEVFVGNDVPIPVPLKDKITFEVLPLPPLHFAVKAPSQVRAGENLKIPVTVDFPAPMNLICRPSLSGSLMRVKSGPYQPPIITPIQLDLGNHTYNLDAHFLPDTPTGEWTGYVSISFGSMGNCHRREVVGESQFAFTLLPAIGLVTPTSVGVVVNPTQVQLLLGAAQRLKVKAEGLAHQLGTGNSANSALLQKDIKDAIEELNKTEAAYKQDEVGAVPPPVSSFFDDIRLDYQEVLKTLSSSVQFSRTGAIFERVNAIGAGASSGLDHAADAVLQTMLHNVAAYEIAAATESLTFNLLVVSDPEDATILYRRRNRQYQQAEHGTDWTIQGISLGKYQIRLEKPGYLPTEGWYDGIKSTTGSIHLKLEPVSSAR